MISRRLIRTWLILIVVLFIGSLTLFALLGTPKSVNGGAPILGWLDPVIAGAIMAVTSSPLAFVLCAIRPKVQVGQAFDETKCPECDYDLSGLESDRCPECGRALNHDESCDSPPKEGSSGG